MVSIQGTNGLHDGDIADMLRYGVGRVLLMLDGDKAGAEACEKIERRITTHADLDAGATPVGIALRIERL